MFIPPCSPQPKREANEEMAADQADQELSAIATATEDAPISVAIPKELCGLCCGHAHFPARNFPFVLGRDWYAQRRGMGASHAPHSWWQKTSRKLREAEA